MVPTQCFEFLGGKQSIIIIFFTHIMNLLTLGISLTAGVSFSKPGAQVKQRLYYYWSYY